MTPTLPPASRVGRTALTVADLGTQTDFYRDVVGLAVLERSSEWAVLGADDVELLVLESAPDAGERHSRAAGLYHNAFRVPTRAALGDALGRIRGHWQLSGASDHLVSEALYLTDPEGNGVEMYRDRSRTEWPDAPEGQVRMATDPLDLESLAADAAGEGAAPAGTDVGHVHLEVADLATFRSFWVDTVGFRETTTYPGASFVAAGDYHHHLAGNVWHDRSGEAGGRGLSWFEVVVPGADALAALRDRVAATDAAVTSTDTGFETADHDGIRVRFRVEA
ncbi:VOC family protein [Salinirubellus salinus]|uniref:VOC family protein n=1 Tax=Salinirubellus salinus TaxID=1364945 RepID=A0A9E7R542_9EURY|nr:VOC family protein [Salinirubellus salinus]UWM56046.1 VOC family protein [Salinirubellus salinus]